MNKVKAFIERGNDGTYGVYVDLKDNTLNYGLLGEGNTVDEAITDFHAGYEEMKSHFERNNKSFKETEFTFHYDIPSFMYYYITYFSMEGLSRLTGINKKRLNQYAEGTRHPTKQTIQKIDNAIYQFTEKFSRVQFV
jgi:hypothetical protein